MTTIFCGHYTCGEINQIRNIRRGVAAAVLQDSVQREMNLAVGREVAGRYAGQWNVCAGGAEADEIDANTMQVCYLSALRRELREEFKLPDDWNATNAMFKATGRFQYIVVGGTPVFVGRMPDGWHRRQITRIMRHAINNPTMYNYAEREMSEVEYLNLGSLNSPEGKRLDVSSFTLAIARRLMQGGYRHMIT